MRLVTPNLTTAVDGDASFDSLGGQVTNHWRDTFIRRGRRAIDILVTKKTSRSNRNYFQIALLGVGIKRDDLEIKLLQQIQDYMLRLLSRVNATRFSRPLYGLLV